MAVRPSTQMMKQTSDNLHSNTIGKRI